jgi:hypothetical protein
MAGPIRNDWPGGGSVLPVLPERLRRRVGDLPGTRNVLHAYIDTDKRMGKDVLKGAGVFFMIDNQKGMIII